MLDDEISAPASRALLPPWMRPIVGTLARDLAGHSIVIPSGTLPAPLLGVLEALAAGLPGDAPPGPRADAPPLVSAFVPLVSLGQADVMAGITDLPEETLRALRSGRGLVVFDGSNEGRVLVDQHVANMHRALDLRGIPAGRAVWIQQNHRMPRLYGDRFGPPGQAPLRILTGHIHAAELWHRLQRREGVNWTFGFAVREQGARRHRWVCLNYALRAHRALLAAWLMERAEPGFLSFSVTRKDLRPVDLAQLLDAVRALSPDDPQGACRAVMRLLEGRAHHPSDVDTFESVVDRIYTLPAAEVESAELFIVAETEMSNRNLLRYTEKTLKALGSGLPMVVFGNPGVIAALRRTGFDVLDDLVDHGYDQVPFPGRRFAAARAAVARFLARPPGFTAAELARLRAAAAHNAAVFRRAIPRHCLIDPLERLFAAARG